MPTKFNKREKNAINPTHNIARVKQSFWKLCTGQRPCRIYIMNDSLAWSCVPVFITLRGLLFYTKDVKPKCLQSVWGLKCWESCTRHKFPYCEFFRRLYTGICNKMNINIPLFVNNCFSPRNRKLGGSENVVKKSPSESQSGRSAGANSVIYFACIVCIITNVQN